MPIGKKKLPRSKEWVRTGGAMGDPTMAELDAFNASGSGVDPSKVHPISSDGGDPNAGVHLLSQKLPGSSDGT